MVCMGLADEKIVVSLSAERKIQGYCKYEQDKVLVR